MADADPITRLNAALDGRYRVERELGAGGMATVYLAEDLRHHRNVALKVLRRELAAVVGSERFLAEIETTANLQHPHILPLFDSGEADGFLFYVMPFVEGESLRDRLDREHQLPVDEAIEIASRVASALDYAHGHGVVHRDIKPANILLSETGEPLVSDFGIALAISAGGGDRLTETGLSLGTPHYMSPEQATGDLNVGPRADIWALGCVLHEMLVGEPPFAGSTPQAVLGRIITADVPRASDERTSVPPHLDAAIGKALEKVPADRFSTARAFANALATPSMTQVGTGPRATEPFVGRRSWWAMGLGSLAVAVVAWAVGYGFGRGDFGPSVYDVGLPDSVPIDFKAYRLPALAVAPDGSFVVYVAQGSAGPVLWFRSLVDDTARPIRGTEGGVGPVLSPDGEVVAFKVGGQLKAVPVKGGPVRVLAEVTDPNGLVWTPWGELLVADHDGTLLRWIDPVAGETSAHNARCPLAWPTGDPSLVLCVGGTRHAIRLDRDEGGTVPIVQQDGDGPTRRLFGSDFRVVGDQYVAYLSPAGDLRVAPIDLPSGTVGRSMTMVTGVRKEALYGAGQFSVSASGTLVYAPGENAEIGRLVEVTADGVAHALPISPAAFLRFDLSPGGRTVAAVVRVVAGQELRLYDVRSGQYAVWRQGSYVGKPLWDQAGNRLLVGLISNDGRPMTVIGSPTAANPTVLEGVLLDQPSGFAPDGRVLVWDGGQALLTEIGAGSLPSDTLAAGVYFPSLSPDGRWLAYQDRTTGQLVLEPYPDLDQRFHVADQAWEAKWISPNELAYWIDHTWYRVSVLPDRDRPLGDPRIWFSDPRFSDTLGESYMVTPEGGIIYVQGPERTTAPYIRVIPDWMPRVRARLAAGR